MRDANRLPAALPSAPHVDKGYRGHNDANPRRVFISGPTIYAAYGLAERIAALTRSMLRFRYRSGSHPGFLTDDCGIGLPWRQVDQQASPPWTISAVTLAILAAKNIVDADRV